MFLRRFGLPSGSFDQPANKMLFACNEIAHSMLAVAIQGTGTHTVPNNGMRSMDPPQLRSARPDRMIYAKLSGMWRYLRLPIHIPMSNSDFKNNSKVPHVSAKRNRANSFIVCPGHDLHFLCKVRTPVQKVCSLHLRTLEAGGDFIRGHRLLGSFWERFLALRSQPLGFSRNFFSLSPRKKVQPWRQLSLVNSGISWGKVSSPSTVSFSLVWAPSEANSQMT